MKPKNLSEVKSQDEFLEYLIDNYYRLLGEGDKFDKFVSWSNVGKDHVLTVTPNSKFVTLEEFEGNRVTKRIATLDAYKDKIKTLRNKPSFEDHPDAKCFVQCENGVWFKNIKTYNVEALDEKQWVTIGELRGWVHIQSGRVIGDWKQSFEKAPEKKEEELTCSEKQNWGTSYAVLGELVDAHKQVKEYKDKYENLAIQYNTIVLGIQSILDEKRSAEKELNEQVKSLEMQITELKSDNQELKNKLNHVVKQILS